MFREKGDQVLSIPYGQRFLMDVLDVARKPDGFATMLLDMSQAKKFRDEFRKRHGIPLTFLHLIIKACAMTIEKYPWSHYMLDGYKIIRPSSIDIGVSVAGRENITPVAVIKEANTKSLKEIVEEFIRKRREVLKEEGENLERLNKIGQWIPLNSIRKALIRFFSKNQGVRRRVIGTFQIVSIGSREIEFHLPNVIGTTALLGMGGVIKRPIVIRDKIEIRPTLYVSIQIDHRMLQVVNSLRFLKRFRRYLEHPFEMLGERE